MGIGLRGILCLTLILVVSADGEGQEAGGLNEASLLQEARHRFDAGDLEEALRLYQSVLTLNPDNLQAIQMAGLIQYKAMYYDAARVLFKKALALSGENNYPLLMLGNIALNEFELISARRYYLQALALDPQNETIKDNLRLAEERIDHAERLAMLYRRARISFMAGVIVGLSLLLLAVFVETKSAFPDGAASLEKPAGTLKDSGR